MQAKYFSTGLIVIIWLTTGAAHAAPPVAALPDPVTNQDYYDNGTAAIDKVELGRMLFFDKILSGNRNISCATCHHPSFASADGLALPLGEGPSGLGTDRRTGDTISESVADRVPRNSPALFNLGAKEFVRLFHDGRVETDDDGYFEGGFVTPAKWKLPKGLDNPLAAQAMFPVTAPDEMAGDKGENPIADAISLNNAAGKGGAWELLAKRLQRIPEYRDLFVRAYPEVVRHPQDIDFVLAANALAAFQAWAFRADNSAFDRYLRGDSSAVSPTEKQGMRLFYGKAACAGCHSGKFQTDHDFHAIAMPQIGPGKNDGSDASYWNETGISAVVEDFGRGGVTFRTEDNYKFRTPSLRNVATTGPWGHAGAYSDLYSVVVHHMDPRTYLEQYDPEQAALPKIGRVVEVTANGSRLSQSFMSDSRRQEYAKRDTWVQNNQKLRQNIAAANELQPQQFSNTEVRQIMAFLQTLTDDRSKWLLSLVPEQVPSGLPVQD